MSELKKIKKEAFKEFCEILGITEEQASDWEDIEGISGLCGVDVETLIEYTYCKTAKQIFNKIVREMKTFELPSGRIIRPKLTLKDLQRIKKEFLGD